MIYKGSQRVKKMVRRGVPWKFLVRGGVQVWPCRRRVPLPQPTFRVLEEDGANGMEKWFEVGFTAPEELTGGAAGYWQDSRGRIRIALQRSENLVDWTDGEFIDCATTAFQNEDGDWEYWDRSIFPVDSAVKTGVLTARMNNVNFPPYGVANPITSIVLAGVIQALPHYPYDMLDAGRRAQLVADMEALGWTGCTVTALGSVGWTMMVPNVFQDNYALGDDFFWEMFLVPDTWGNVVNPCNRSGFSGEWVNSANVRTAVPKQFARLKYSHPPS